MLTISNFHWSLPGSLLVLSIPTFRLLKGEIVYLQGPSGSGKTTLLNLLTGVLPSPLSAQCRAGFPSIGYVMHESSLLSWSTVNQNVVVEEYLRRCSPPPGYFEDLCREFGLDATVMTRRAIKLSLGMRQRVEIALALSFSPDLLVLDEALAGIDTANKSVIMSRLQKCVRAEGLTVLATSHQLADILRFAERIYSIENGVIGDEIVLTTPVEERARFSSDELLAMKQATAIISPY